MHTSTRYLTLLAGLTAMLSTAPLSAQSAVAAATPASAAARADREIAVGQTKSGELTSEDPRLEDGEHYHSYSFEGRANDSIVVTLRSSSFDSYLAIFTPDNEWEEQDDDGAGGSNARLDVTLPSTGRYVIVVTSYGGDETGAYTLSISESDGTHAVDDDWTLYGRAPDADADLSYMPSSIRSYADGVFEVWTRWVYDGMQPASPGGDPYDHEKRLMRVDCNAHRIGMVSFVEYSGQSTVNSQTIKTVEMSPAVPESVGEALVRRVCSR